MATKQKGVFSHPPLEFQRFERGVLVKVRNYGLVYLSDATWEGVVAFVTRPEAFREIQNGPNSDGGMAVDRPGSEVLERAILRATKGRDVIEIRESTEAGEDQPEAGSQGREEGQGDKRVSVRSSHRSRSEDGLVRF